MSSTCFSLAHNTTLITKNNLLMRLALFIALLNAALTPAAAQSLITFAGGSATGASGSFSWSVGEIVVSTAQTAAAATTQGFQQPPTAAAMVVDTVTENPVQVNAITPNGDDTNEFFLIKNAELMPNNRLVILNRWQEVIYQTEGYRNDWSGTAQNGIPLPTAAYYYIFWPNRNKKTAFRGTIHVLR